MAIQPAPKFSFMTNNMFADFENDHIKFEKSIKSDDYFRLLKKIEKNRKIFILGNGGLMDISSHGAADLSRLIPGKSFRAFNDCGYLTSNGNDFGFESIFTKWLNDTILNIENKNEVLIIGLSCSGNSSNVINALQWGEDNGYATFLISGVKSIKKPESVDELTFDCKYFHTTEILTMKLFYDIVYKNGSHCPDIAGEIKRKEV